eukprot:m.334853 g.334853  ORF g.334853 m.334853 type:complete len:64 (-) comp20516_c2_seq6:424-615(-)
MAGSTVGKAYRKVYGQIAHHLECTDTMLYRRRTTNILLQVVHTHAVFINLQDRCETLLRFFFS